MAESGVVNLDDKVKSKVAMVYGQMNEPPGNHALLDRSDHGRKISMTGKDVLLFVDNIYRYTLAGMYPHCWAIMPSAVGYQPTLAEEMGVLQERYFYQDWFHYFGTGRIRTCG